MDKYVDLKENEIDKVKRIVYSFFQSKLWILVGIVLSVYRMYLTYDLPIYALSTAAYDDALMTNMTLFLLFGCWLGPYYQFTMPKGIVYPLYLFLIHKSNFSYLFVTQLLYMIGAFLIVLAVHKKGKGFLVDCLIYIILIFNPLMSSITVFARIYRNVLVPIEVLYIFAGILGIFMRLEQRNLKLVFWSLIAGFGVLALNMTREDSIWIMPFFIVAMIVFLVMIFIMVMKTKKSKSYYLIKVGLVLLPLLILTVGLQTVKGINKRYYGLSVCTDTTDTHFTDAIKAMYSVEDVEDIPKVSVSRAKMELLYANSPSLQSVREYIDASLNVWVDAEGQNVTDAHFFWAIRDGLGAAGLYQNAVETDRFYEKVADELNAAMDDGRLTRRTTMPSALMSPWRKGYFRDLMEAYKLSYQFISGFNSCETMITESVDNGKGGIKLFEDLTNDKAVYPGELAMVNSTLFKKQDVLNVILGIYSRINRIILPVALILFVIMSVALIFCEEYRKKNWKIWLSSLGMLLSAFVLISGVAYTHISAYPAISASYLSGVYPLMLLFEAVVFLKHGLNWNGLNWKTKK